MVQWIDLFPTFIEIAGGTMASDLDGKSFANVLRGVSTSHRTVIYTTHSGDGDKNIYPIRSMRTDRFKYILNLLPNYAHSTHIDRGGGSGDGWRYFDEWVSAAKSDPKAAERVRAYHQRPAEELYDLSIDPSERNNLAADPLHAARLSEMRMQLEAWMKSQGDKKTVFNTPRALDDPYPPRE
jgi:arylsulfatase A-like enzyme